MTNVGAVTARYEADASKWDAEAAKATAALGRLSRQSRETTSALQRSSASANEHAAALSRTSQATANITAQLRSMAGGFLALETARRAFNLAQTAAQTEDARRVFENMGGSLSKMRTLTRGLIDDATLVKKSNLANVMGIAADDFGKLANIALAAAKATGQSAEFMFDSIVTGAARQSKLILDNLGIMVSVEEANQKYAASLGLVASQLTDVQKKQAFTNEVIRKGEPLLARAAELGDTNSDAFARMNASLSNAGDTLGRVLMPIMRSVADELSTWSSLINGFEMSMDGFVRTVIRAAARAADGFVQTFFGAISQAFAAAGIKLGGDFDALAEKAIKALGVAERATITLSDAQAGITGPAPTGGGRPTLTLTDTINPLAGSGRSAAPASGGGDAFGSWSNGSVSVDERIAIAFEKGLRRRGPLPIEFASTDELDALARTVGFVQGEGQEIVLKDSAPTPRVDTAAITASALSSFSSGFAMDIGGGLLDFARQQTDIIRQGINDVVETVLSLAGQGFNETFDILGKSAGVFLALGLLFAPITVPLTVFTAGLTLAVIPLLALAATVFALTTKSQAWADTQQRMDDLFGELILALEPFAEALLLNTGIAEYFFEALKVLSFALVATAIHLGPLFGATSEQIEAMREGARKIRDMEFDPDPVRDEDARRRFRDGLREGATELGKLANVGRELTNLPSGYKIAGAEYGVSRGTGAPGTMQGGLVVNIQNYHATNTPVNEERKLQNIARRGRSHDRNGSPYSNPGRRN